jgi:hypothetical protein
MEPASGRVSFQTVGYYATAAECQHAKIKAEDQVDRTYVTLECRPIKHQ